MLNREAFAYKWAKIQESHIRIVPIIRLKKTGFYPRVPERRSWMFRVYQSIFLRKLTRKNLRPHISDRVGDDPNLWITIFGFHASDAIMILNKFHQFGNILKSVVPLTYNNFEGCIRDKTRKMVQFPPMNPAHHPNYLHIKFENKKQVESALKIDGTAFAGYQFLGVKYRE